jgi:hypothetical protein
MGRVQQLDLFQSLGLLLEECRTILPGIQALFGFQLIVVFQPGFAEKLDATHQGLHVLSIGLIVLAVILLMTPAVYHRQTRPQEASEHGVHLATRLMTWSMVPMALGMCIDLYIVARLVLEQTLAVAVSICLLGLFAGFWYFLPRAGKPKR